MSVCLLATLHKNFQTDLYEIFREGQQWASEQMVDPDHRMDTEICFLDSSLLGDMESGY